MNHEPANKIKAVVASYYRYVRNYPLVVIEGNYCGADVDVVDGRGYLTQKGGTGNYVFIPDEARP
jgi:hypothetical protein